MKIEPGYFEHFCNAFRLPMEKVFMQIWLPDRELVERFLKNPNQGKYFAMLLRFLLILLLFSPLFLIVIIYTPKGAIVLAPAVLLLIVVVVDAFLKKMRWAQKGFSSYQHGLLLADQLNSLVQVFKGYQKRLKNAFLDKHGGLHLQFNQGFFINIALHIKRENTLYEYFSEFKVRTDQLYLYLKEGVIDPKQKEANPMLKKFFTAWEEEVSKVSKVPIDLTIKYGFATLSATLSQKQLSKLAHKKMLDALLERTKIAMDFFC